MSGSLRRTDLAADGLPPALRRAGLHVALALVVLAVIGWLAWAWLRGAGGLDGVAERYGLRAALVLVPLQTLISLSISPIPSDVVGFATSLIYGFWLGTLFGWLAWMAGALIQYGAVRRAARGLDAESLRARLPTWLRRFPADHPVFLICGRWFPLGPHVVNTVAAALGVPLGRFAWCAAIGIAPVAALIAALAAAVDGR
jgi:uncharacterized membrane protein YdjX (TVP38/TMEM64 family)